MSDARQDTEAELRRLAPAIARALGAGWCAREKHTRYQELAGPDGLLVWLAATHPDARKGRVVVRGSLPLRTRHGQILLDHGISNPQITVAIARGADAVAREIKRRLLPGYKRAVSKAQARIVLVEDEHDQIRTLAKRFGAICGVKVKTDDVRFYLPDELASYGSVTCQGDRVRIEGTFSVAQGEEILRALVALAKRGRV